MSDEKSESPAAVSPTSEQIGGLKVNKGEHVAAWKKDEVHQIPDNNMWIGEPSHLESFC
jgi:hypothetical protein